MVTPPSPLEMQLARERKARLTAEFARKRTYSILFAVVFLILAGIATAFAQPMLTFNAIVISLIFVVRAMDAHGMVQEVRRRSDKTLVVRMPFIERDTPGKTATDTGFSH